MTIRLLIIPIDVHIVQRGEPTTNQSVLVFCFILLHCCHNFARLRSLELEQLAVSGQRGVHLWQILSQAKYGVIGVQARKPQG